MANRLDNYWPTEASDSMTPEQVEALWVIVIHRETSRAWQRRAETAERLFGVSFMANVGLLFTLGMVLWWSL